MTTPTDLAAVRAAAELIRSWLHVDKSPQDHPWWALDMRDLVKAESQAESLLVGYILQTIPADAHLPIDAEWLREVWGAERHMQSVSSCDLTVRGNEVSISLYFDKRGTVFNRAGMQVDGQAVWLPSTLKTRHQFTQLATSLGLTRHDATRTMPLPCQHNIPSN